MLTFDASLHEYRWNGVRVPSVTQVLAQCIDFSMVSRDVMEAKGALGTAVHAACELDDANDLVEESVHDSVRGYLEGYRKFKRDKVTKVIATEMPVYHALFGYAGKLDLLTEFDDARWLIDWKTPLAINPATALQTAGYVNALSRELTGEKGPSSIKRAALQLKADGTYRLHEFTNPNDFSTFVSFVNVFKWKESNLK
jgi:hypothetical protein